MNPEMLKKTVLALLLSLLLGLVAYFIYQRYVRKELSPELEVPPAPEIESVLPEGESFKAVSVQFNRDSFRKLPRSLAVYQGKVTKTDARNWSEKFGFSGTGDLEDEAWVWLKEEEAMFKFYPERNYLEYFTPSLTEGKSLSLEDLKKVALRTVSNYNLYDGEEGPEVFETRYLGKVGYEVGETSSLATADFVEFKISPRLNLLPVISDSYPFYLSSVQLTKDGNLSALTHHLFAGLEELSAKFPLKDFQTVIENLEGGQGKVISVEGLGYEIPHPKSLILYEIEIAYLRPQKGQGTVQPVFVLEGQAEFQTEFEGSKRGDVKVMLTALKEE